MQFGAKSLYAENICKPNTEICGANECAWFNWSMPLKYHDFANSWSGWVSDSRVIEFRACGETEPTSEPRTVATSYESHHLDKIHLTNCTCKDHEAFGRGRNFWVEFWSKFQ